MSRVLFLVALIACFAGCRDDGSTDPAAAGRRAYMASCIACHSLDPGRDGTLGPAIAGSSRELIEARVLRAEYPPGYEPKRDTKLMPAQPFLVSQIDILAAYLALP